jgi:alpha/beta superfamily hydrolase
MTLIIPAGSVEIESHLGEPEGEAQGGAVLCHPHPVYGGTMDNRVVYRAAKAAAKAGFAALRFNFRGVGKSTGRYDHGLGEMEDVAAAIDWMEKQYPDKPLAVLGYSFGAWVGLKVGCSDPRIRAIVGIGLPLDLYDFEYLVYYSNPSLYIVGAQDEFCSPVNLQNMIRRLPPASRIHRLPDADHFFSGQVEEVEVLIEQFLRGLQPDQTMP